MNVLEVSLDTERGKGSGKWRLYPIGDMHADLKKFNRARLERYVKLIADDPHGMWIFVGDAIDGTTPSHHWFDPTVVAPEMFDEGAYIMAAALMCERILEPLKDRPGIVLQGNHDIRKGIQWTGFSAELARRLGAQYGGDECLVRVRANTTNDTRGSIVWVVYAHHGSGGGMLPGGKVNRWLRAAQLTDAQVMVRGHVHDGDVRITPWYTISRKGPPKLVKRHRAWVTAPSFMEQRVEGIHDYVSQRGYHIPNDEGLIYLELTNAASKTPSDIRRIEAPF